MTGDHDDDHPELALDDADARLIAELREAGPAAAGEPDWGALSAGIGQAIDGEVRRQRRRRALAFGGVVLAAAAVAALLVWPASRRAAPETARDPSTAPPAQATDAAVAPDPIAETHEAHPALDRGVDDLLDGLDDSDAEAMAALAVPDDLGGITLDDELIDEAAALDGALGEQADALEDRLLPDGAWIDDLSDDDLERAVELLEAG